MNWPRLPLTSHSKIVILTGAGISAESGIKTFRDQNGLWEEHDVMDVATPEGFAKDPELVYRFYNQRRAQLLSSEVAPNPAHHALARLEKNWQGEVVIVTQNVDDLHERAGSSNVLHMHGELLKMRCPRTSGVYPSPLEVNSTSICPKCGTSGHMRPHIVWFGEVPFFMEEIERHVSECELFIAIGTSGLVYPAALLVSWARGAGARTIEMNLELTERSSVFHHTFHDPASTLVPSFVDHLFKAASSPAF